jgi:RNA polymerase sigma-70 factor (ECF subfamily)
VQDTFLAVWRKPGSYQRGGAVAAWIWGIGVRRLIDQLRRRPAATWTASHDEAQVSAEDQVLLGVEHGDLAGVLRGLSPELRAVVQATVLDGLTTREAARLLGIPAGTVKTRMSRARTPPPSPCRPPPSWLPPSPWRSWPHGWLPTAGAGWRDPPRCWSWP